MNRARLRELGFPSPAMVEQVVECVAAMVQMHHRTDDVLRQLDRAERVLDRYEA